MKIKWLAIQKSPPQAFTMLLGLLKLTLDYIWRREKTSLKHNILTINIIHAANAMNNF